MTADGKRGTFHLPEECGPYEIEGILGIIGNYDTGSIILAALVCRSDETVLVNSVSGRLVRAIIGSERSFDMFLGGMTEECAR